MKIKLLSSKTINKIATGEVIDRPVSVVKECIENAIDAGASNIQIDMMRGGRSLISVSDDGDGITKDDLLLAITRHATSKLNDENIDKISYMGFRGEALASMATAGQLILQSKQGIDGWQINGDTMDITPVAHRKGTTVKVQNLFHSMPNRIRFLKPESSEIVACTNLINAIAIAHSNICFSLNHNDKSILNFNSKSNRIFEVLGQDFINNALYFDTGEYYQDMSRIRLHGHISVPTYNRKTYNNMFLFVNKRLVKDAFLQKLVRTAYFNTLPEGMNPSVALFLDLPIECVDVNVHPHKTEVRFTNENLVRDIVIQSIRNTIQNAKTRVILSSKPKASQLELHDSGCSYHDTKKNSAELKQEYLGIARFQIQNKYIVAENASGLILVDQHAAHERIVLEHIKCCNKISSQPLLIPITHDFGKAANEFIMSLNLQMIGIGLSSEDFTIINIHSIPLLPGNVDVIELLYDIINDSELFSEVFQVHVNKILQKVACHSSIRAGRQMNLNEMNALLRLIEKTSFGSQCVHGRPTYIELSIHTLNKMFERE